MIAEKVSKLVQHNFPLILEGFNDLICIVESSYNFKIEGVNGNGGLELLGFKDTDFIGNSLLNYIHQEDLRKITQLLREKKESKRKKTEIRITNRKNIYIWYEIKIFTIKDDQNQEKLLLILRDISERKNLEMQLKEHVKELTCLYGITTLFETPNISIDEMLLGVLRQISPAWQFPEIICAKIEYNGKVIQTENFKETKWYLSAQEKFADNRLEFIVYYLEDKLFLKEEELLVKEIGNRLKSLIVRKETEQNLKQSEDKFRTISEESLSGLTIIQNNKLVFANRAASEIYGYPLEELQSWSLQDSIAVVHPDDLEMLKVKFKERFTSKETKILTYTCRIINKNKSIKWITIRTKNFIFQGKVAIIVSIVDINDQKRAEQELKTSEEKYRILFENSPFAIFLFDTKGKIIDTNPVSEVLFINQNRELIIGKTIKEILQTKDFLPTSFPQQLFEHITRLVKGDNPKPLEVIINRFDGSKLWINIQINIIQMENRYIFQSIVQDITEKKELELKLKDSEEYFRLILENANDLIAVINDKFEFEYINEALNFNILGYSTEDLIRKPVFTIIHPEDIKKAVTILKEGWEKGEAFVELRIKHKNGTYYWFEIKGKTFFNRKNEKKALIISRDINNRKIALKKLQESEEKYKTLFERSPFGISLLDSSGIVINTNSATELIGYNRKDIIGKHFRNLIFVPDEYLPEITKMFKQLIKTGNSDPIEIQLFQKDGNSFFVYLRSSMVKIEDRPYYIIMSENITTLKETQQHLKESEEKYRLITENANDIIAVLNQRFAVEFANKKPGYELLGYDVEEIIGKTALDLIHPEDIKITSKSVRKSVINGKAVVEARLKHKQGYYIWFELKGNTYYNDNNELKTLLFGRDISERKKADQKLIESEQKFRNMSEQNLMGICILQDNVIKYLNQAMADIYGYTLEEVLNWEPMEFFKIFSPDSLELGREQAFKKQIDASNQLIHYIIHGVKKTGELIWVDNYSKTITYEGRSADLVSQIDITEKIEIDKKLKSSEERLKFLVFSSPAMLYTLKTSGDFGITFISENVIELTGYHPRDFIDSSEFWVNNIYPDDKKMVLTTLEKLVDQGRVLYDYRFKFKDGTYHWMRDEVKVLRDEKGNSMEAIGSWIDITERKVAEEALRESEKKFRTIFEAIPDLFFLVDHRGTFLEYSGRQDDLYIPPSEFIGRRFSEVMPNYLTDKTMGAINRTLNTKKSQVFEYDLIMNGQKCFYEARFLYFSQNKVVVFIRNISEKKRYNETFAELNTCFLSFSDDHQNNITMLLETCRKLLGAEKVIWAFESGLEGSEHIHILNNEGELVNLTHKKFENEYMVSELFKATHDYPQVFLNSTQFDYSMRDQYIKDYAIKTCLGKLIKVGEKLNSGIAAFFKFNPPISNIEQLILFLVSDAIIVERNRWLARMQIEEQNKRLNEISRLKTEFLSRTSHELKTPLISIKGFTDLLLSLHSSKLDSDMISILAEIKNGSIRLENIINSLLDTSRIEEGRMNLNLSKEDLAFLIKFCAKELEGLLHLRKLSMKIDIDDKLIVVFDKERMYEVINNLLINAIKYTPPTGQIHVSSEIKDGNVIISIKDSGIGITKEEHKQLFTQFGKIERYGKGWDVDVEGSGLGLYIAKGIIELHGGKIWAESEGRNKGSTFSFSLPY